MHAKEDYATTKALNRAIIACQEARDVTFVLRVERSTYHKNHLAHSISREFGKYLPASLVFEVFVKHYAVSLTLHYSFIGDSR